MNPARLGVVDGVNVCVQCHSQGQPIAKPIEGKYYDWAVGYRPGLKLQDFWQLEEHKLGETTFTHFADGTAHKNRMQGNDFVQSLMYTRGVMCSTCHDVHGTANNADLRKPPQQMCLDVPRPAVGERSAHGDARAAHAPPGELRRQSVHRLPYAGDRNAARRRQRPQPHLQVHLAGDDGSAEGAQSLHDLPCGQDDEVGARRAEVLA